MSHPTTRLVAITVRLKEPEHQRLSKVAERDGRSMGQQARMMILRDLDANEPEQAAA